MKAVSVLCAIGYMAAALIILGATGNMGPEGWLAQALAAAGAIPLGYWCAHCDTKEDL